MKRKLAAAGSLFVRMIRDESGSEPVEYVLVSGAVVAASYSAIKSVGERVETLWRSLDTAMSAVGA